MAAESEHQSMTVAEHRLADSLQSVCMSRALALSVSEAM